MDGLAEKRAELDRLRPLLPRALRALERLHDVEITYGSNAIEGNTLTAAETQLVIEQGITIAGKRLRDHMEALDHHDALGWVRGLAAQDRRLTEFDIRALHRLVLMRSQPEICGRYADQGRFVLTDAGRHAFPSPAEVPALMGDFAAWLAAAPPTPESAFTAHLRLVTIHPFNDGNGRTARLLMNLLLLRGGWPPVALRPAERPAYIAALQAHQAGGGETAFMRLMAARLEATLDEMLAALRQAMPPG